MDANENMLVCGRTGSAKSTLVAHAAAMSTLQLVVLDQQLNSTARTIYKHCLEVGKPVILDDLDDTEQHFPLHLLNPTEVGIDYWREIESLQETLVRRRGGANLDANPLLELVTEMWCRLIPPTMTLQRALSIFRMGDEFKDAIRVCRDEQCREWWMDLPVNSASRERITGAAERILSVLSRDGVACRTYRGTNTFLDMIDQGYSFCSEGGQRISQSELRFITATRLKQLLRYKEQGGQARLMIIIEESEAGQMIGPQEVKALQTLRKSGVQFVIVCQEPHWIDDATTQVVLQNTNHIWLSSGSSYVARIAAEDLMAAYNPYAVKEQLQRPMLFGDDEFLEQRNNYFTADEQRQMFIKWLMQLPRGHGFAIANGEVRHIKFPRFETSISDDLAEHWRRSQPWLQPTTYLGHGMRSTSSSTSDTHTQSTRRLDPESLDPTRSPLDGLFD